MSFLPTNRLTRRLGNRLILWFALIFGLCLLVIFSVSYFFLSKSIEKKDHEAIEERWKDYAEALHVDGIEGLQHRMQVDSGTPGGSRFVVGIKWGERRLLFHSKGPLNEHAEHLRRELLPDEAEGPFWRELPLPGLKFNVEAYTAPFGHDTWLTIGKTDLDRRQELARYRWWFLAAIVPILIIGLIAGLLFSRKALEPLRNLSHTLKTLESGNLSARVSTTGSGDELDDLGLLFNRLLDRIEQLVQGMRDTLDNVAHDLRTPIARFRGLAETGLSLESPKIQADALAEAMESSDQILRLLNTLMDLSSIESGTLTLRREEFDLSKLVLDMADMVRLEAEEKGVLLKTVADTPLVISAERARIGVAITNLLDNAVKYTPSGGRVEARLEKVGPLAVLTVTDTGSGIAPSELPRIWERLYRGDTSRSQAGLGLGLSIVKANVLAHGGQVSVESTPGIGTTFLVELPLSIPA